MALITLRQLLDEAAERHAAIPAFNVNNLEQIQAILSAASYTNSPVILQASLGARKYAGMIFLKKLIQGALETYPHLAICVHQDHGHTPQVCFEAIQAGFSSVMMDGSLEEDGKTPASFESNIERTQRVVDVAHKMGVSVEGEIGCLGSLETGFAGEEDGSGEIGRAHV
jgi:fructose-bisphosphate aldolase class II